MKQFKLEINMKYLKIQNNGILDIRLVALMGGTTKANDQYKIGQFGTGLKYTIAYLFRNNIDFKIFAGAEQINVKTETERIGETDFEIVCINENRTSITTGMGEQWSAWMIIRELWCNSLDEGGSLVTTIDDSSILAGEDEKTTFYIQITPEIKSVIDDWDKYFIQDFEPIWENERFAIHLNDKKERLCLYKNGVLIYQHPDIKSLFCYDIKCAEINELREFKGSVHYEILNALRNPGKDVVSYFLKNITEDHYEGSELDYNWFVQFADIWRDVIGGNRIVGTGSYSTYEEHDISVDYSNVIELPKKVYSALTKQFEGVGALAISDDKTDFYEVDDIELKAKVTECLETLKSSMYSMNKNCVIKYGFFQNKKTTVSANRNKKEIMISKSAITLTTESLCAQIIEHNEYISLKHDKDSRDYTKHFIELYANSVLSNSGVER